MPGPRARTSRPDKLGLGGEGAASPAPPGPRLLHPASPEAQEAQGYLRPGAQRGQFPKAGWALATLWAPGAGLPAAPPLSTPKPGAERAGEP